MSIVANNKQLSESFVRYSHLCYDRNLVGAAGGNLSVRIPDTDIFLVTASGISLRDISLENIMIVDGQGKLIEGSEGLRPSKEISFHLAIYNVKPQVNAIVHVHPTFTTVYASASMQIPLVTVSSKLKVKQGIIVQEENPGSQELCSEVIKAVRESSEDTTVLLMQGHGLVGYRSNLCDAFDDVELIEDTAKIAYYGSLLK